MRIRQRFLPACLALLSASPLAAETVFPSPHWRNSIDFPDDAFRSQGFDSDDLGWIKFLIFVSDPTKVYFQNSVQFPFHYDFATALVQEYQGMSRAQFDQITLHAQGQQAILGAVILPHWTPNMPPGEVIREYGIELVRQDAYDPAVVVSLFQLVRSAVAAEPGVQSFYFPSYEQLSSAIENEAYFASQGIQISSSSRWTRGNVCYASGWALGRLKFFTGSQISSAYLAGQLVPDDILLTDGVPADMPPLAGILTLTPSTPNSHVAILAQTFGIPFAFLAVSADAARAQQLVGRRIALNAYGGSFGSNVRMIDVEDTLTPQQVSEILELKEPAPLNIQPMAAFGAYSTPTLNLTPAETRYVGGKAAHFGFLRRTIPNNSPVATAFTFDLWNAFLEQTISTGLTLRQYIHAHLDGYTYPPNMANLANDLAAVRNTIRSGANVGFNPALTAAVMATLSDPQYSFDPNRNIRFRSSTNVEDTAQFTGAGLYDSFSGCLADDLDGDTAGPSICDPTETGERGVFRAIRRVFASFYNDNAFLARLRYGVNEAEAGMALLAHHSFPDEFELANGVATFQRTSSSHDVLLVTQKGAVSVTNPTDGSIPEEVGVQVYSFGTYPTILSYSNLVPLGATVMTWEKDYRDLTALLVPVANAYSQYVGRARVLLDFEYKKLAPAGDLEVKQLREIPQPGNQPSITPFLLNDPTEYCTYQGEFGDVFANHRLKSRWTLRTLNLWLTGENLHASLYDDVELEYVDGIAVRSLGSGLADWPNASHEFVNSTSTDHWTLADMENPRDYALETTEIPLAVAPSRSPLLTVRDLGFGCLSVVVEYEKPESSWTWQGPATTTTDWIRLCPCPQPQPGDLPQQRVMIGPKGERITSQFVWPPDPMAAAGYTAPLVRWVQTTIEGYTSSPIVLTDWYSQTYRPEHHNFTEHFLFEPVLSPNLSPALKSELKSKNIRMIHVHHGISPGSVFTLYGFIPPGDFDRDNDVDPDDFGHFQSCATGPAAGPPDEGCFDADLDRDRDVDQADFGLFQRCLSGVNVTANPGCAN